MSLMQSEKGELKVKGLSPILSVPDIQAAVDYYVRVLGFELDWLYGDPPVHGAVRRDSVQIQLSRNPALALGSRNFVFVESAEPFHAIHRANGAEIVSPIENKPWGMREYTVRDPWGNELRFAGPEKFERPPDARDSLPANIRIIERIPTVEEYVAITKSVRWGHNPQALPAALKGSSHGIVAVDVADSVEPKTVGMLRIIGDGVLAFLIQEVAVMPSHQNQRIGTAMIEAALSWVRRSAPKGATVVLLTPKPGFYERCGFKADIGMHLKT